MERAYDVVVVGLGGMGSATAAHLAKRGKRVLGLEQFGRLHANGSSHGHSRIIRQAYFEAPEYVPLLHRSYALWRELEVESGQPDLLTITGGLNIGTPESEFVTGSLASAKQHNLEYEYLNHQEVGERFPGFRLTDDLVAVYEPNAGFLKPEECIDAHLTVAEQHGAELRFNQPMAGWSVDGDGVLVKTATGTVRADRLVITAGPWAGQVLADLGLPLTVRRIVNAHFEPSEPEHYAADRCPVYLFQVPEGDYYGFPMLPGQGVKLGRHDGGEITSPQTIRREIDNAEIDALRDVLARYLPGAVGPVSHTLTCMYTDTPDANFILDRHHDHPQIVYGCGFSGHGYKFASVIGEILADLAADGSSHHDIGFLSASRFVS